MYYNRHLLIQIKNNLFKNKVIILLGPRQVGKTTLLKQIQKDFEEDKKIKFWDCTDPILRKSLTEKSILELKNEFESEDLLFLDEAQLVANIGQTLKLLHDHLPKLQVIATGSSSFELANSLNEPLTGRNLTYYLYPISSLELPQTPTVYQATILNDFLRFGFYPSVLNSLDEKNKIEELKFLTSDYLFKDILTLAEVKSSDVLRNLLEALALQVGNEVNYTELGNLVGLNKVTVQRYIDLLEKSFVIFRLRSLARNPRNEISKTKKIYFWDLGIRNSLIRNFNPLELRNDTGALFENFCIVEKMKQNEYQRIFVNNYFWRTYNQQEIDYIEEKDGVLNCYEFKYNDRKKTKLPNNFAKNYPNNTFKVINRENWLDFVK